MAAWIGIPWRWNGFLAGLIEPSTLAEKNANIYQFSTKGFFVQCGCIFLFLFFFLFFGYFAFRTCGISKHPHDYSTIVIILRILLCKLRQHMSNTWIARNNKKAFSYYVLSSSINVALYCKIWFYNSAKKNILTFIHTDGWVNHARRLPAHLEQWGSGTLQQSSWGLN